MEEKKTIKISLSTFFLILAIIVIVIMGVFIFKFYNDKKVADSEVKDLNNQVIGLESTINTLEGKINSLEGTINNNANNITNNIVNSENVENTQNNDDTTSNSTSKTFSNDEIKKSIQNYLDLKGASAGSPEGLLVKLELTSYGQYKDRTDDNYIKTNIKYSDYKSKMLNYMTEQWFENKFTNYYKNIDGYLYFFDGGATGMSFDVESVNIKGAYSDLNYIANVYNIHIDESKELEHVEFHIADYNGKCVISYCDY